ncbi:dTDP-4-dehydrorhamnose reductase [Arthrobacter sp. zg-Y20]|uniref:dTDP-4-dehydrorhamnose reductase n=1 Tax=unclassified Arthrobacter TaxID=235627 RepID=UPI001D15727A|nr:MULTISPECIES: dTDP-4-dehydrorhamnose reductase [unclassified Arthrobacter]MCC3276849.1 dTDP-4-dehydrorhamnose reductase [Arthrobacter sp. zg-Y20]MDK1317010.1 dTDP-4-dehydrorhamnose reductase [Arthrobacter sp. zg.Y20]WIB05276.1 dTDP-4-dehydrorhamnose reductase [Arthrobacter sp. zg-Y20]
MTGASGPKPLSVTETPIPGLLVCELPVMSDNRGWFKENWQREKMVALGLPDFNPVQNNVSFNTKKGATRGIHAEPWDKYVSVASGRIFGAWVDLREGSTFGRTFFTELDPSRAVYVPRGVGNAFQTLEDSTAYTYLVNDHWSAEAQSQYVFLNLADETAGIPWPLDLAGAEISAKDRVHPRLADVPPMPPRRTLVLGANGQLGKALRNALARRTDVEFAGRGELDLSDPSALAQVDWKNYSTVINAAAYTAVDDAEGSGRADAWQVNGAAVAELARLAQEHHLTLVHVSTDYVFDGARAGHPEDEPFAPLGVYGQTKAAGDLAVATVPRHYILRTSWVIGEGHNFVRTMAALAERGVSPSVVDDQIGRLTFAEDLAGAIVHLLDAGAPYGTYNVSNEGPSMSWADVAREVFVLLGKPGDRVTGVSTAEYFAGRSAAPRPLNSVLDLDKLRATGFTPPPAQERLAAYVAGLADRERAE